jgi:2-phosphosulfolactate phosphatase
LSNITVLATPDLLTGRDLKGSVAVVIDVLRATSSIATAFSSGCRKLIPARSKEEALALREKNPQALLTGEQGGLKIEGFDLGNCPFEYSAGNVAGRTLVMTTSNGTRTVLGASEAGASPVFLCSFLNLDAVAAACTAACQGRSGLPAKELAIACSGSHGEFSLEDYACAGALAEDLASQGLFRLNKDAQEAVKVFRDYGRDPLRAMKDSPHGQQLEGMGFAKDLVYCANVSALDVVPVFADGAVTLHKESR